MFISENSIDRFVSVRGLSAPTRVSYRSALRIFRTWCDGEGATQVDEVLLYEWRRYLIGRYHINTAKLYLTVTRLYLNWAAGHGLCAPVTSAVRNIRTGTASMKDALTAEQLRKILAVLREKGDGEIAVRNFAIVVLIVACGLRVLEASRLRLKDLYQRSGYWVMSVHGKGRDGYTDEVPVPESVIAAVERYLAHRHPAGIRFLAADEPLFMPYGNKKRRKPLTPRTISRIIKTAMVDAGFDSPRLTAHSLRHTTVTLSLTGGAAVHEVRQYVRHASIVTTERYIHHRNVLTNPCASVMADVLAPEVSFLLPRGKTKTAPHAARPLFRPAPARDNLPPPSPIVRQLLDVL